MQIYYDLESIPFLEDHALTIGNFDGLHLGHQMLLQELKKNKHHVVITFTNHPLQILRNEKVDLLTTKKQKLALFKEHGVQNTCIFPFDKTFAKTTYQEFLTLLSQKGMRKLILGKGSCIGANRAGDEEAICKLAKTLHFDAIFLEKKKKQAIALSTSAIKQQILKGDFQSVSAMLGRNYQVEIENQQDQLLPKDGSYLVQFQQKEIRITVTNGKVDQLQKGEVTFLPHPQDKSRADDAFSFQSQT